MFTNLFTDGNTGSIKASCTCGCDCGCDPEDVEKKGRVGGAKGTAGASASKDSNPSS